MPLSAAHHLRRAFVAAAALFAVTAPSCGFGGGGPASQVQTLRVLAVTADRPYAAPGELVTLRLTYADARDEPDEPRAIQVTWLGGCIGSLGADYGDCYPALAPALKSIASGEPTPGIAAQEIAPPESSGVPGATSFEMAIAEGALEGEAPGEMVPGALAYVFFAACAGTARPTEVGAQGGFPLECLGEDGTLLGGNDFVVGYTEVLVRADGVTNENPPNSGLSLDDMPLGDDPDSAPVVARCLPESERTEEASGCSPALPEPCTTYELEALVADVAEPDPDATALTGKPLREAVWVNYFTDGGAIAGSTRLISDATTGYEPDHFTTFTPPPEPGLVTLWAVVHDARGGASVTRGLVRVE